MALELSDLDQRIWESELADFVPLKLFDAHVHIYRKEHAKPHHDNQQAEAKEWYSRPIPTLDYKALRLAYARLFPDREVHFAAFGWVLRNIDFDEVNAFTATQMSADGLSVPVMLVHPGFAPQKVFDAVTLYGFRGLKPYPFYASDEVECRITDMLPEPLIEVANEKELFIVLHLGKKLGIADPHNVKDLEYLTHRYPRVRWNLAHMARSSVAWPLERAIDRIKHFPNLWFDFSSVTNADVFLLAFQNFSLKRIMYGSDMPSDLIRGNLVSFGMGWGLMTEQEVTSMGVNHCDNRCTFVLYETVRALRRAARLHGLERNHIDDLFFHNAIAFVHKKPVSAPNVLDNLALPQSAILQ